MQIAAKIRLLDEPREGAAFSRGDFATAFAQLRWNERQAECSVQGRFVIAGNLDVVVEPEQAVLVQREPMGEGSLPKGDIVRLGSREVLERRAETLGRHEPEIGLK